MTFARAFQRGENESAEQFAERIGPLIEASLKLKEKRDAPATPASDVPAVDDDPFAI